MTLYNGYESSISQYEIEIKILKSQIQVKKAAIEYLQGFLE